MVSKVGGGSFLQSWHYPNFTKMRTLAYLTYGYDVVWGKNRADPDNKGSNKTLTSQAVEGEKERGEER